MKTFAIRLGWVLIALLCQVASACNAQSRTFPITYATPTTAQAAAQGTFLDPFTYCSAVVTIDKPDARYSGEAVPDSVIQGYIKAAALQTSTEPIDIFKKTTIWRCMDKQVYACNFGANLPCDSKANIDKTSTQAMADFCKANANSDFIPAAITGHDTIYSWHCVKDAPEMLEQISQVDAAGYIANIWYKLEPVP
jgi:hypothetical protein